MPQFMRSLVNGPLIVWSLLCASAPAQEPSAADEIDAHVASLRRQSEDATRAIGQRESVLLSAAETLDRAAHKAAGMEERQARWGQAVSLLDGFNGQNPGHPRISEFQLQAAVYRWAQGQSWRDAADLRPSDPRPREQAIAAMDDAIVRLRAVSRNGLDKNIEDNLRYRVARALADRAELEPQGTPGRKDREAQALEAIGEPVSEPGLKGFAGLLKADLMRRNGNLEEALRELAAASKAVPAPPEREIYETLVPILIDQGRVAEAETAIKASQMPPIIKELVVFRVSLARVLRAAPGDERRGLERELFEKADALRKQKGQDARLGLAVLARSGLEPGPDQEPVAWEILGEAVELLGDAPRAAAMLRQAARRADELGRSEAAAGYRLRGGGLLYQDGKFAEADELLSRVAADPKAGAHRARAGMLRGLARGRALAAGAPGVTPESYARALQDQIREFPKDPATDEARWLLGSLLHASSESGKAMDLWSAIAPASPRWLDARLARYELMRRTLEAQLFISDRHVLLAEFKKLGDELTSDLEKARGDMARVELGLADVRLNLLPLVGKPRKALDDTVAIGSRNTSPLQRYRIRLLRIVALIHLGPPFLEAEREAQGHATWAEAGGRDALLETIRLLDLCASFSDADLRQRRFGLVMRMLIQPALQDGDESRWSSAQRSELVIRLPRAFLFLGDERGARASLRDWTGPPEGARDDLLRDIADTYSRLEAYELAIDVERLRSKDLAAGSPAWFESRYSLALAYFHAGRLKESAQLIDATSILHPDLGGGTIEKKLIKLRQRLGQQR